MKLMIDEHDSNEELKKKIQPMKIEQIDLENQKKEVPQTYVLNYWDPNKKLFYDQKTKSNLHFIFNRKMLFGNRMDLATRSMIMCQFVLIIVFTSALTAQYVNKHLNWILMIFPILSYLAALLNSVLVFTKDPGMISKSQKVKIDYQSYQTIKYPKLFYEKYCVTCEIMRPATASHCSHCNICVFGFDHHCYVFGNCVGIRNWKNFIIGLFCINVTVFYLFIVNSYIISILATKNPSYEKYLGGESGYGIAIYVLIGATMVVCLSCLRMAMKFICGVPLFIAAMVLLGYISFSEKYEDYYENPFLYMVFQIQLCIIKVQCIPPMTAGCQSAIEFKTTKQRAVIMCHLQKQLQQDANKYHEDCKQLRQGGCCQWLKNICSLLSYRYPGSQILD